MRIPKYRLHRHSGRGVIQCRALYGSDRLHYLPGSHGSEESLAAYAKEIARIARKDNPLPASLANHTIGAFLLAFMDHAAVTYLPRQDRQNGDFLTFKVLARIINDLYGDTLTRDFGAIELEHLRDKMIERGWARSNINRQINRVRQIFRWGVKNKYVPADVLLVLQIVRGLQVGRTKAREAEPVEPVEFSAVAAVLPHVSPTIAAMIELHWLTGMRSGELIAMHRDQIDRSGDVWLYRPASHKNKWRNQDRVVCLGPRGRDIILPFLSTDGFLFRPAVAISQQGRGIKPVGRGRSAVGERYKTHTYQQAIRYGFIKLAQQLTGKKERPPKKHGSLRRWLADRGVVYWHPHQLRHSRATITRAHYGVEGSQSQLGHQNIKATELYAERSLSLARRIAGETG